MKSLAELKRRLVVGAAVHTDNLIYPNMSGPRTVIKAQTNSVCMTFPPQHEKHRDSALGSWLYYPKAAEVTFDGSDTATFLDDGKPWLRLTVKS